MSDIVEARHAHVAEVLRLEAERDAWHRRRPSWRLYAKRCNLTVATRDPAR